MLDGFQNKYYFFKSVGYISFWESRNSLKVTLLLEKIPSELRSFDLYLAGGEIDLKIFTASISQSITQNKLNPSYTYNFRINLPQNNSLSDFDTAYIVRSDDENKVRLYEARSENPSIETQKLMEQQRIADMQKNVEKLNEAKTEENQSNITPSVIEKDVYNAPQPAAAERPKASRAPDRVLGEAAEFDPFNTTNSAYKWWVSEDFNQINSILHKMDIHLPTYAAKTLFNNMNTFKHAILGRYIGVENRYFIIVGVPVKTLPDVNLHTSPARPMSCSKFYNNTGYKGYLLFYIDYASTAMVKAVVV